MQQKRKNKLTEMYEGREGGSEGGWDQPNDAGTERQITAGKCVGLMPVCVCEPNK